MKSPVLAACLFLSWAANAQEKLIYHTIRTDNDGRIVEANDEFFHVGELYLDVEDISRLWGRDRQLNLRAGRFRAAKRVSV